MSIPVSIDPLGTLGASPLPPGFKRAQYLRSDGQQGINTLLKADTLSRVMLDVAFEERIGERWNGAQSGGNNYRFSVLTTGNVYVRGAVQLAYSEDVYVGNARVTIELTPTSFRVDDTVLPIEPGQGPHDDFYLFARNLSWTPGCNKQRLFAFKAWGEDGALVADMVPAVRESDGKPCMVDVLTGTPYYNVYSGEFTTNFDE